MEAPGIALDIPAGALDGSQTISIYAAAPAADGSTSISKAFRFEPSGLEFAQPISVHLDVPAGANGIVRWSRLGDPTSFEFAGFVSNGVADAQNTHFSTAEATAEDGCDDLVPGEALCAPSSAPEEDCRQLCDCVDSDPMPSGITLPNIHLCDRDPANDNGTCPLDPTLPPAQGPEEQFGERDGNACTGWGWVSTQIYLCDCLASAPVVTVAPSTMNTPELCAMPETQGPTGNWLCDSTPSYPICLGASCPPVGVQTKNPVPSECPTGSPDRRLCDYQWNAYVGTGPTDSEGCLGYYTCDDGQGHVVNKSTTGHVENCAVITIPSASSNLLRERQIRLHARLGLRRQCGRARRLRRADCRPNTLWSELRRRGHIRRHERCGIGQVDRARAHDLCLV